MVDGSATEVVILFARILWIGDGAASALAQPRFSVTAAATALDGLRIFEQQEFEAVLVRFPLPDFSSEAPLLEELQRIQPYTPVVVDSLHASVPDVVKLMHLGAFHVLQNGDPTSVLSLAARSKHLQAPAPAAEEVWRRFLIGESRAMQRIADVIRLVAPRRSTVLITGETGTGKEVVAQAIHAAGNRSHTNMVAVNCSAFPETLLEAELFGHVKGAFTGATGTRIGRFEQAHRGTIFLDEIGDMPLNLQSKLLRIVQQRELQRLGSSESVHIDVRVIAATNVALRERIKAGKFREDLYYRLNVVPVEVPALRDRISDIPLLVRHFLDKICCQEEMPPKQIAHETMRRLASYCWPGNVRELENSVEKAVVLSGARTLLWPGDFQLPANVHPIDFRRSAQPFVSVPDQGLDFEHTVGAIERNILEQALEKTGGNKKMAAEMLGLKRTTLSAKLRSLSLAAVAAAG